MKILALDLGSTIGWATVEDGKVLTWGEQTFPGDRAHRLHAFREWLLEALAWCPDTVIYERPFSRGLHATRSLWGMAGIVEEAVVDRAACLDIVPSTLKKWATGSGRANKEQMIIAAVRLVHPPQSGPWAEMREHEADAIILGLYAAENIEPGD